MAINVQNIERFKFIAHKIIPLVYDDSLSYYEFLCKVMQKLNEVVSSLDNQNEILEEFDEDIISWETRTDNKYNEFVNNIDALFEAFKQGEVAARTAFMDTIIGSYNASTHYAVGQYARYGNNVYKCTTATSGEVWNPAHWTQVVYADDLSERQSDYEESITAQLGAFETEITGQQTTFEQNLTEQQNEFESAMQAQWDEFFDQYLETLGVVQTTGTSTTNVMSQKAVTDELGKINRYESIIDDKLFVNSDNIFDKDSCIRLKRLDSQGIPQDNTTHFTTDFIRCKKGDTLYLKRINTTTGQLVTFSPNTVCVYDYAKQLITYWQTEVTFPYEIVNDDACYIRFSAGSYYLDFDILLTKYDATEYIEYSKTPINVPLINKNMFYKESESDCLLVSGTIEGTTGIEQDNDKRVRSSYIALSECNSIEFTPNSACMLFKYDNNKNYTGKVTHSGSEYPVIESGKVNIKALNIDATYIIVVLANSNMSTVISPNDYFLKKIENSEISLSTRMTKLENYMQQKVKSDREIDEYICADIISEFAKPNHTGNGICFAKVNDNIELWIFGTSNDEGTNTAILKKYKLNGDNTFTFLSDVTHNIGHCNSISYCAETDTLICGNGSGDYDLPNKIYIVPNASTRETMMLSDVIVIDCSSYTFGTKINVIWGEQNFGRYDIAYCLLNDGHKILRIQLGKGSNSFNYGTMISATDNEFNGTFNILDERTWGDRTKDYYNAIQGACFIDGTIYCGFGHGSGNVDVHSFRLKKRELVKNGLNIIKYNADGTKSSKTTASVATYNGKLFAFDNANVREIKPF